MAFNGKSGICSFIAKTRTWLSARDFTTEFSTENKSWLLNVFIIFVKPISELTTGYGAPHTSAAQRVSQLLYLQGMHLHSAINVIANYMRPKAESQCLADDN